MLTKGLQLRRFEEKDLDRVMYINLKCLPENYSRGFFLDLHHRYPNTFIVATLDGLVVGYVMCRMETGFSNVRRFGVVRKGHVISIAVLPEHRRMGLGRALMIETLKAMIDYYATECFLEVRVSNIPAISLYDKLEFKVVRRIGRYYRDGEDAYVMALDLRDRPLF